MGDSPRSAESERRQQVFSEAELRILQAGREAAELKEKLAKAEALLQQREQAQAVTWIKLQERVGQEEETIERRKQAVASRELATNQTAQAIQLEQARTVQVQGQIQTEADTLREQFNLREAELLRREAADDAAREQLNRSNAELRRQQEALQRVSEECGHKVSTSQARWQAL